MGSGTAKWGSGQRFLALLGKHAASAQGVCLEQGQPERVGCGQWRGGVPSSSGYGLGGEMLNLG